MENEKIEEAARAADANRAWCAVRGDGIRLAESRPGAGSVTADGWPDPPESRSTLPWCDRQEIRDWIGESAELREHFQHEWCSVFDILDAPLEFRTKVALILSVCRLPERRLRLLAAAWASLAARDEPAVLETLRDDASPSLRREVREHLAREIGVSLTRDQEHGPDSRFRRLRVAWSALRDDLPAEGLVLEVLRTLERLSLAGDQRWPEDSMRSTLRGLLESEFGNPGRLRSLTDRENRCGYGCLGQEERNQKSAAEDHGYGSLALPASYPESWLQDWRSHRARIPSPADRNRRSRRPGHNARDYPWDHLTEPENDGIYTDFAAWERWVSERDWNLIDFDDLGISERIELYSMCVDAADRVVGKAKRDWPLDGHQEPSEVPSPWVLYESLPLEARYLYELRRLDGVPRNSEEASAQTERCNALWGQLTAAQREALEALLLARTDDRCAQDVEGER
jgi:hypothetical protein